jgi:hypothetical protein
VPGSTRQSGRHPGRPRRRRGRGVGARTSLGASPSGGGALGHMTSDARYQALRCVFEQKTTRSGENPPFG